MNEPIPEAVAEFLKEHDCGKYKHDPDRYGDDWSHYDIEALVDLAINLGNQLSTLQRENEELKKAVCQECGGKGGVDSGGTTPWGSGITIPCPSCSIDWKARAEKAEKELEVAKASETLASAYAAAFENKLTKLRTDVKPLICLWPYNTSVKAFLAAHPEFRT